MKKGKRLEELIHLIQKTLIGNDKTQIYKNKRIKNTSGNSREFDVVIDSKINDISIRIVIECKDYKTPVSVEKIEAFHSKCLRIPEINKKIIISPSGFQKDAISAARDFGIEIFEFKYIDKSIINNWLIREFYPIEIYTSFDHVEINFNETVEENEINNETLFTFPDFQDGISLPSFIKNSFIAYEHLKSEMDSFFHSSLVTSKQFQLRFTKSDNLSLKKNPNIKAESLNCIFHFKKQDVLPTKYEEIISSKKDTMANIATYPYTENLELKVFTTKKFEDEKLTVLIMDKSSGEIQSSQNYYVEIIPK